MARPGPLRNLRSVAVRRTWPVGLADVPVIRASALTVPSAPLRYRQIAQRRRQIERRTGAPRHLEHGLAQSEPQFVDGDPVGETDTHRREQPQRLLSPVGLQRCQVHRLGGGIDLGGGTEPRRRALQVGQGRGETDIKR
jgi:hypothetical protein